MHGLKYKTKLDQVEGLESGERRELKKVTEKFAFRANEYYLSLIDWSDPDDPIRRIIVPDMGELDEWGRLDASNEQSYKKASGLEHKYTSVAVLLVSNTCGAFCRFCFRKRLFMNDNDEVDKDISDGIKYIRNHPEITNVLVTGGDPLILSTQRLEEIIRRLREIEHVHIIRIGSKIPVFNPYRIVDDPALLKMFKRYSSGKKRIYVVAHFNHPRELTKVAVRGMDLLREAGVITINQTPLIAGVNDDPGVLAELFKKLSFYGIPPYYVFQCRPTLGNKTYAVPVEEGYHTFEKAKADCSGLARRARFVMSHATGKIEILGLTDRNIYFKYHRAADPEDHSRFMVFRRNPNAYWFDDYRILVDESYIWPQVKYLEAN